ncbi:MAG: RNase P subunit p30 family protein [Nanoarchaeota archaeon]
MPTDIVVPLRNEIEMMKMAKRLGYDTLVMAYTKEPKDALVPPEGLKIWIASLEKPAQWATLCLARAKPDSRALFEHGALDGVYGLETVTPKDFIHHRGSGLNTVLADIASRKKKAVVFDFSILLNNTGGDRGVLIGRMSQNIKICRKSKPPLAIGSFATTPYRMRAPHDLRAVFEMIGMHPAEAKEAIEYMGRAAFSRDEIKKGKAIGNAVRAVKE